MAVRSLHILRKLFAYLQNSWVHQTRSKNRRGRHLVLETLEDRLTPSAGVQEQYMLDLINRFRANPSAELSLILNANNFYVNSALSTYGVDMNVLASQFAALTPAPPLAWNDALASAALAHSQLMLTDQTQSHQLPGELDPVTRIIDAGYTNYAWMGENVFAWATSVFEGEAAFLIDWGSNPPTGIQNPPGHRDNLISTDLREIGIGLVTAPPAGSSVGPLLITQDLGNRSSFGNPWLLGSVYTDLNSDGYYEPGEGIGSATITITGTGGTFQTTSTPAGGYQIQVPAGTYQVTASGGGLAAPLTKTVTIGSDNVQADFIGNQSTGKANPALLGTPNPTTVTLGTTATTLTDSAVLSGGSNPTGTVTFKLYQGSTLVDTETATVNGNGTYTTPTGYTLPTTGTVTGTYQWNISYNGDGSNNAASETNNAGEQVVVSKASPTLVATPNPTNVTLGTTTTTLTDSAVLAGGNFETGTITFTLYQGSTLLDTETVAVNGNGTYSTPTGYTLPTTGTVAATNQWNVTYNGDTDNNLISENNNAAEQVLINKASPTVVANPNPTTVTLGAAAPNLKDSAVLAAGYSPTGTVTFTLFKGSTLLDTETVAVNGNGTYATPTGYTLPTTGTVTGTYQWNVTYNGNANNNLVSENNNAAEQVMVSSASPTVVATPNPTTVTLGTTSQNLKDSAVLSASYFPNGTITFTLFKGSTLLDTETVSVSGNGTYATPTGYTLPTTGTVTGTYQWNVTYNGNTNNNSVSENNNVAEQVAVNAAGQSLVGTPNPTTVTLGTTASTLKDSAVLSGGANPTGTVTFNLYQGSTLLDTETATVNGNGTYATPTGYTLPTTGTVTGTYQWNVTYNGDTNNSPVSENNNAAEQVAVSKAGSTLLATPNPTTVTLGTTASTLKDSVVLSGGYNQTGSITFTLYRGSTLLDTETASVSGGGTYATPTGYTLPITGTVTGTYQWNVTYNGDTNNNSASENNNVAEQVVVSKANSTLLATPNPTTVTLGTTASLLKDSTVLSGGYNQTGSITFTLFLGSILVDSETVSVSGSGTYATPTGYTLPTTGTVTGTYQWNVTYNGDTNNNLASETNNAAEQVVVSSASPTVSATPNPTTVTLGTTAANLKDSVVLSAGYFPTGTVTFKLFQGSTLLDAETVAVNGNGTYATPVGYTLPTTGTVTGTYQWNVTYNGNANNISVSENNNAAEQVVASPASPTVVATPNLTAVTLGTTPQALKDSAVLSAGYFPTGTITFTLFQGSTQLDTETVSVSGNGTYATPIGYTLSTAGTMTGTYQWNVTYNGNTNNNSASENNNAAEQVVVNSASPTVVATPNPTNIMLSTTAPALKDSAVLSAGYFPTGTITFTLFKGSTLLDTETVTVNGNGTYTTPTGYTLPTTGTYQWNVSYNGNTNNNSVSENNNVAEKVAVNSVGLSLIGTPSPTAVTLGTTAPILKDSAVLSGGSIPTGTITFSLYQGSTLVDTETATVNGDGIYTTPTGYTLPSSGTVVGTYQWNIAYSGDATNGPVSENNNAAEKVAVTLASPTIVATPSPTSFTLGTTSPTLKDSVVLAAGYFPTGTVTFRLYQVGVMLVDTETVTVNGNGTYATPAGYTLPTTGTVFGTYQWNVSYNGDANNNLASENGNVAEQAVVHAANPTVVATPNVTTVTLGTTSPTLKDSAVLSAGYYPTGTLTFRLYQVGVMLVDTETVTVNGNGTYATPAGYTLPTTGTVTGTYLWNVSYSGNSNNISASENGNVAEQVVVSSASPSVVATPNVTTVTLGTTSPNLKDSAVLSAGYYPTGTITFRLYHGSTLVDAETVAVNGNGTYATPAGYTLPPPGSVTGTYQWNVTYNGNTNNNLASENNNAAEQVMVSSASPTVVATPNSTTVILGATAPNLKDSAVLASGYYPTGTVTFKLYQGSTLVDTETVTVNGNGTYATLIGYTLPTTGAVTGAYQWNVTYNGNTNNNSISEINNAGEQVVVNSASPTVVATPSPTAVTLGTTSPTLKDSAVLAAGYYPTGTVTFTLYQGSTLVDTETATVNGNGTYTTPTGYKLPTTGTVTGTYQWNVTYIGNTNNNPVSENNNAAEKALVNSASPTVVATPNPTAVILGSTPPTLKDSAVLAAGYFPTGTVTFTLYQGSTLVDTETATVNGNGTYTTPTGYTLPTTGTVTGTYQWNVSYIGDANNKSASEINNVAEKVVVSSAFPKVVATPNSTTVTLGTTSPTLTDSVVLTAGYFPTGTLTFRLYLVGVMLVDTETVTVNGNGTYATPTGYTLPATGSAIGTYQWNVSYNGDANNNLASENGNVAEQVVVRAASPTVLATPNPTTVTLGTTSPNLKDSAVLSAGYYPTGTLTFRLYLVGVMLVDTETVTVNGNGTYATPAGYTLPSAGTVRGTYQWIVSYSGNSNNISASANNNATEQVVVSSASPTVVATPSTTAVTLGTTSPNLKDSAVLSAGYYPTGTVTFNLYHGNTLVDSETVAVNGNGTYATPFGYTLPTTGTVTGTYQWNVSYNGNTNNILASENNNPAEQVVVGTTALPASPTITGPASQTTNVMPTITWSASAGAAGYDLQILNVTTGITQIIHVTTNFYTPTTNLNVGQYRIWVRATNASGVAGSWSAEWDFTVIPPG